MTACSSSSTSCGDECEFAVKTFDKRVLAASKTPQNARTGLLNEITIMRACEHPNIIQLLEVYESDSSVYLVQSALRGGELFESIIRARGNFSERNAAKIISQLLSALEHIHAKGIMHRDIKPENLILVDKSDDHQIKLADFGLAAYIGEELLYKRCGTPGYVAPEILNDQQYDTKVDVFSAGVILYILISGCSPFYGKEYNEILAKNKSCNISFDFSKLSYEVSAEAINLLKKMLAVNPKERVSAREALSHGFFEKYNCDHLNTSLGSLDTGYDDSTAYENIQQFQAKFNFFKVKANNSYHTGAAQINGLASLVSRTSMMGELNKTGSESNYCLSPKDDKQQPSRKRDFHILIGDTWNTSTGNEYLASIMTKGSGSCQSARVLNSTIDTAIMNHDVKDSRKQVVKHSHIRFF